MGESGWDSPKPRPQDPPLWSMRVVKSTLNNVTVAAGEGGGVCSAGCSPVMKPETENIGAHSNVKNPEERPS